MLIILSKLIINHCSPVLAGLKTANMFNCITSKQAEIKEEISCLNKRLNPYDLYLDILKQNDKSLLIYLYRKSRLEAELKDEKIKVFLSSLGYKWQNGNACQNAIDSLKLRISESPCFPHEIGIFLGYPFEDVMGFIENKGMNFKLCGYWKVYCNEEYAKKCFIKYKSCTENYIKEFSLGKTLTDLAI